MLSLSLLLLFGSFVLMQPVSAGSEVVLQSGDTITAVGGRVLCVGCGPGGGGVTNIMVSVTHDVTVTVGGSGSTTVNVGFTVPEESETVVSSDCGGSLPTGVTCNPTQFQTFVSPPDPDTIDASFTLTLTTSSSTPVGTYPITLQVANGGCSTPSQASMAHLCDLGVSADLTSAIGGPSDFNLIVNPAVIPEYPLGLPLLAILIVIGYGVIRRRTRTIASS